MTDKQTPPDWVLRREAELCGVTWLDNLDYDFLRERYHSARDPSFRALCDMIEKYEQPPADRKVLCAGKAVAECWGNERPMPLLTNACIRAIELFEQGFGK